jgi:tRNA 2-thiouridine synthesizing protein C
MKKYLFVLRKPPHSGAYIQELLDIILTTAAFDQSVSLLLMDEGVFTLKDHQRPETIGFKDTAAIFKVLEMYDVNTIYVEKESLQERGLSIENLFLPVIPVQRKNTSLLMTQFDVIIPS